MKKEWGRMKGKLWWGRDAWEATWLIGFNAVDLTLLYVNARCIVFNVWKFNLNGLKNGFCN